MRCVYIVSIFLVVFLFSGCVQPDVCSAISCDDVNSNYFVGDCNKRVDNELIKFNKAIENAVIFQGSQTLEFNPYTECGFVNDAWVEIPLFGDTNSEVCLSVCGYAKEQCYFSTVFISDLNFSTSKCLNVPNYTSFRNEETKSMCPDKNKSELGYLLVDPSVRGSIVPGQYVMTNATPEDYNFPIVCMWYKE
jgi:hypothetical protein